VNQNSSHAWSRQFDEFRCRDCGSHAGFRSRRRTFAERFILPLLLLQPVRCGECFRRDYRMVFTPVRKRITELTVPRPPAKESAPPLKRNVA
jgi:hypothetical protein